MARPRTSRHRFEDDDDDVEVEELSRGLRKTPAPTQLSSTPAPDSVGSRVYIDLEEYVMVETAVAPATPSTRTTRSAFPLHSGTASSRRRQRQFTDLDNEEIEIQTPTKRTRITDVIYAEPPEDVLARLHEVRRLHAQNQPPASARKASITTATRHTSTIISNRQSTVTPSGHGMSVNMAIVLDDD